MAKNPHVLIIPFPLQGHLNPILHLCARLLAGGVRLTMLATPHLKIPSLGIIDQINVHILEDEANAKTAAPQKDSDLIKMLAESFRASVTKGFHGVIDEHGTDSNSAFKAVIYDSVTPWVLDLAHEHGIKGAVLFTQACGVSSVYYHVSRRSLQVPGDDASVIKLPSLPDMNRRDLPYFVYDMESFPFILDALLGQFSRFGKEDWRLINTFDEIEHQEIDWLSSKAKILAVGPIIPTSSTLLEDDHSCIKWLDQKQENSVIYISFGTAADVPQKQIEELLDAVKQLGIDFLWSARDSEQEKFPADFASDQGLLVNWCPQTRVLSHKAVACFVTHGGWNSTLEAICSGVPMVVVPQWGDQTMNAKLIADVWRIGVRVKCDRAHIIGSDEVATAIGHILQGESAAEIRRNAARMKELALGAIAEGGSSDRNMAEFLDGLLST